MGKLYLDPVLPWLSGAGAVGVGLVLPMEGKGAWAACRGRLEGVGVEVRREVGEELGGGQSE
jgi:hypothetical protein